MIPLGSSAGVLPRVPTNRLINGDFPLTIVKPPLIDVNLGAVSTPLNASPVIHFLQSRTQRRNSSASSVQTFITVQKEGEKLIEFRNFNGGWTPKLNKENEVLVYTTKSKTKEPTLEVGLSSEQQNDLSVEKPSTPPTVQQRCQRDSETPCYLESKSDSQVIAVSTHELFNENEETTEPNKSKRYRSKTATKSSSTNRTKKQLKGRKSSRKKTGKKKTLKRNAVFERLSKLGAGEKVQESSASSKDNSRRNSTTIIYNQSNGNILNIRQLQTTYRPANKTRQNLTYLPRVPFSSSSQSKNSQNSPIKKSEEELSDIVGNNSVSPSARKSLGWGYEDDGRATCRKVYLSEVQSRMMCGAPSAPPGTPTADHLRRVEYIPSLLDIKSQRVFKAKLQKIELKFKIEEQKKKEKSVKEEHKKFLESIVQLKQRQRAEIYALNKVMTQLENVNFQKFMEEKEADSLPV